jgi:hypothetical protein
MDYEHKMRKDTDKLLRRECDYVPIPGKSKKTVLSPVQKVKPVQLFDRNRKE